MMVRLSNDRPRAVTSEDGIRVKVLRRNDGRKAEGKANALRQPSGNWSGYWNRQRGLLTALAATVALTGILIGREVQGRGQEAHVTTVYHTVKPGETLWSIARRYGNPEHDGMENVLALTEANGFEGRAVITPGQRILIPVENPDELQKIASNVAAK